MTATLQDRLRTRATELLADHRTRDVDVLIEAAAELSRLESACESAVVEIDRLRRQLEVRQAASSPIPDGPVVVYGELQGYFGER